MSHLDRYITEQYIDVLARDTGVTREEARSALRRVLGFPPAPPLLPSLLPNPGYPGGRVRGHSSPAAMLLVLALVGAAWTAVAGLVVALICGWRP